MEVGVNMGKIKSIGMAEARPRLTQLVDDVNAGGDPYLIISGSKVKAVLISIEQYNDMIEKLEDLADAAELLEAQSDHEATISFEEHLEKSKPVFNRKTGESKKSVSTSP
jgi:prevent-host-death family protein